RGPRTLDGCEFLVSLARRDVVVEYEGLCEEAGAHAGIVDLVTFNVVNAVLAAPPAGNAQTGSGNARAESRGDWLLVNVAPDYASIVIMRGEHAIFYRNRSAESDGTLGDLVHQTGMYYEDRLQGAGFSRVILAGTSGMRGEGDEVRRSLEDRLTTSVDTF